MVQQMYVYVANPLGWETGRDITLDRDRMIDDGIIQCGRSDNYVSDNI